MNKIQALKLFFVSGSIFYLLGSVAHFFGLTIFPFFDSALYQTVSRYSHIIGRDNFFFTVLIHRQRSNKKYRLA